MYNTPYINSYNPQVSVDRINNQIAELEKLKSQIPQQPIGQPAINQTFQLASNNQGGMRYVDNIDQVNKEMVIGDTPYFSKDLSILWIKNTKGEIKTYELNEIIQKDDRDIQIEFLKAQIEDLRKELIRNEPSNANANEPSKEQKSTSVSTTRTIKKK